MFTRRSSTWWCCWAAYFWFTARCADPSRPLHDRRHRRQDRLDIAARTQPEDRAAIVEQVEFRVAAAPDQLLLAFGVRPGICKVFPHQVWIDAQESAADILREGESLIPIGFQIVVEDAADSARLIAVLEEKIFVAPFAVLVVRRDFGMGVACGLHCGMESDAVRIGVNAALVQHGREIGSPAEPSLGSHDEPCVHVDCRHARIVRMRDQRNPGGPESWVFLGARYFLAEFPRKFAVHRRAMHADFLKDTTVHHRHYATATGRAVMVGALPRGPDKTACPAVGERSIRRQ